MSEKEKKKTFSRKILFLSSFRKNKKLNNIKEETSFAGIAEIETQNGSESFLDPTSTALLDTVCLETLEQSELGAVGVSSTSASALLSSLALESVAADHHDVLHHLNSPGIQRFQNAHSMSISNDSGIDCNVLLSEKTSPELKAVLSEKLDAVENQPTSLGAMLYCPPNSTETDSLEAASAIETFDYHNNTMKSDQTSPNYVETRHTEIPLNQLTPVGDDLMENHANKTDETKTEEVRKRLEDELRESQMNGLQIDVPHSVVSPITMTLASSVSANHRALNATKVSGTLVASEKSAFAKCKSIKRSVSDVGKGLLGRFRHKKREHEVTRDDSFLGDMNSTVNNTKTRFKKSRSLKFSKSKKHQLFNSSQISLNDTNIDNDASICEEGGIFKRTSYDFSRSEKADLSFNEANHRSSRRKLKSKPLQSSSPQPDGVAMRSRHGSNGRRSHSVGPESIQDLTSSICEMTSALLEKSQTSCSTLVLSKTNSAESIACACDCKKRNSDPLCCERHKAPSHVDMEFNNLNICDLISDCSTSVHTRDRYSHTNKFVPETDYDRDKSVFDLDSSYLCVDTDRDRDENVDIRTCEVDTESDSDCSDSDCSECCRNGGHIGRSTTDTSSSDTTPRKCRSPYCDTDSAAGQSLTDVGSSVSSQSVSSDSRPSTPDGCRSSSQLCPENNPSSPYSVSFTELNEENSRYFESKLNGSFNNQSFHEVYNECDSPARQGTYVDNIDGSPCIYPYGDTPASSPASSPVTDPIGNCQTFAANPNIQAGATNFIQSLDICRRKNPHTYTNTNRFSVNDSICLAKHAKRKRFPSHDEYNVSRDQSVLENSPQNNSLYLNRSGMDTSMSISPSRGRSPRRRYVPSRTRNSAAKSEFWVERHIGQVYSPANRVLQKNRGLSETDLCKQILDLYVSDAEESGLEPPESEMSFGESFCQPVEETGSSDEESVLQFGTYVAPRHVVKETNVDDFSTSNFATCYTAKAKTRRLQGDPTTSLLRGEDRRKAAINEKKQAMQTPLPTTPDNIPMSRSLPQRQRNRHSLNFSLPHDVYSHSKHRQTLNANLQQINSVDLNTSLKSSSRRLNTSLQQMSTSDLNSSLRKQNSERKTRSRSANNLHNIDRSSRKHFQERVTLTREGDLRPSSESWRRCPPVGEDYKKQVQVQSRTALKDRTNTQPVHLSSLEMPSVSMERKTEVEHPTGKENQEQLSMTDHHFDRLTMLHTVRNGRQKVRCLSIREAQSVIKHYPPPKEATAISWGQTLSEIDLSRHTPMKTQLPTKPILLQRGDAFPYTEDKPSPIVITKKRKLKVNSKKYKKWPW